MILSDYHVHSVFCDGKSTVEETVLQAIENNMYALGFSGHEWDPGMEEWCMSPENTLKYIEEVTRLKKKHCDRIEIYLGIERDYYSKPQGHEYDYIIGSVHRVEKDGVLWDVDYSPEYFGKIFHNLYGGDSQSLTRDYYETLIKCIKEVKPTFVGHFDLITKFNENNRFFNESSKNYLSIAVDAMKECFRHCEIFEMNSGAVSRGYRSNPYPQMEILKEMKKLGVKIILTSDCHYHPNLCFGFNDCIELLKQAGYTSVVEIRKDGLKEKSITG